MHHTVSDLLNIFCPSGPRILFFTCTYLLERKNTTRKIKREINQIKSNVVSKVLPVFDYICTEPRPRPFHPLLYSHSKLLRPNLINYSKHYLPYSLSNKDHFNKTVSILCKHIIPFCFDFSIK